MNRQAEKWLLSSIALTCYEIVGYILGRPSETIRGDLHLFDDLCADSLDMVEIESALSEHFAVTLSVQDLPGIETIDDLCRLVERSIISKTVTNTK